MSFTEAIKKEARLKAHYRCCICEQIAPLEVHHIVPQEERDPNLPEVRNACYYLTNNFHPSTYQIRLSRVHSRA